MRLPRLAFAACLAAPALLLSGLLSGLLAGPANAQDSAAETESETLEYALIAQYAAARADYWSAFGTVDSDVIAYIISPEFQGAPAWPTTRQSFLIVRGEDTTILASDGLSDPFADSQSAEPGFGAEVYLESPGIVGADFETIRASWQFSLIENFAQNVADFGGINSAIDRYETISFELPAPTDMPPRWVTDRGTVGALINLKTPERAEFAQLAPDVQIRMLPLTILLPDETEYVIAGGASAREEISRHLLEQGDGITSSINRRSALD